MKRIRTAMVGLAVAAPIGLGLAAATPAVAAETGVTAVRALPSCVSGYGVARYNQFGVRGGDEGVVFNRCSTSVRVGIDFNNSSDACITVAAGRYGSAIAGQFGRYRGLYAC